MIPALAKRDEFGRQSFGVTGKTMDTLIALLGIAGWIALVWKLGIR